MNRLRRIAIILTTISALTLLVLGNTALAKPTGGRPCIVVFHVPFADKYYELPMWMWGRPLLVFAVSALAALGCWIALLVRSISRQERTAHIERLKTR